MTDTLEEGSPSPQHHGPLSTGRRWLPRWAPTSDAQLAASEASILAPIRPIISQRMVAGLNTIATVHPKGAVAPAVAPDNGTDPFAFAHASIANCGVTSSAVNEAFERYGAQTASAPNVQMPSTLQSSSSVPERAPRNPAVDGGDGCDGGAFRRPFPPKSSTTGLATLDAARHTSIICVHGFCGGVANWLPVWRAFAAANDVYAFDLPGFARSERPRGVRGFASAEASLEWFLSYFERWFEAMGFGTVDHSLPDAERARLAVERRRARSSTTTCCPAEKNVSKAGSSGSNSEEIVLVGHSFGGYLCAQFALRHPHLVDRVVLADAWGIRRADQEENAKRRAKLPPLTTLAGLKAIVLDVACNNLLWGSMLRFFGPLTPFLLPRARPEFTAAWAPHLDDPRHFYDYTYHCNARPHMIGEVGVNALRLAPLSARLPLIDQFCRFSRAVRWHVLYGDRSWMVSDDAIELVKGLNEGAAAEEGASLPCVATYGLVAGAGHQIAVDNAKGFASAVLAYLSEAN